VTDDGKSNAYGNLVDSRPATVKLGIPVRAAAVDTAPVDDSRESGALDRRSSAVVIGTSVIGIEGAAALRGGANRTFVERIHGL